MFVIIAPVEVTAERPRHISRALLVVVNNYSSPPGDPRREGFPLPELSRQRRYLVLAICCLSLFIVGIDSTIVNVALPSIGKDLHAPVSGLQWTIDAYTLVMASLLMLSGSTADRLGRRRVFQIGLALFTLGSLACSLAPTLGWLVAFRALQAIGGSMLNPVAMSIITNTFTEPGERARAIGVWGGVFGLSMAMGPVVGGALVDSVGWRGVFWVNIPVGIAAIVLTALFVPESRAARGRRPDPFGQILIIALLGSLTYGIIEGPSYGWGSPRILVFFVVAVAALVAFLVCESRRAEPLIDLRFFRSLPFSGATLTAVSALSALAGFLFLTTLYLQDVRGDRPLVAGLFLLPMAVVMAISAPLAGRMLARSGARLPLLIAGGGLTAAGILLSRLTASTAPGYLILCFVVFGIGSGWVNAPITNSAVSGMPRSQAGVASGIASTSRQVGNSLGVAIMGSVLAANLHGSMRAGFVSATRPGWWIIAACGVVVIILALVTTSRAGKASAERTASLVAHAEEKIPARAA
jgi:EmrB/QacA subfamily drug resistance transporter